ncbi:MAG: sodium:proton antiporter [Chlorobi bacterium]|nr:sodium:proton antiporter [Chlorobiota bacterium]
MEMTVNPLWIIPFILLLAAIAMMPFINGAWWEKNYRYVASGLATVTAAYYLFGLDAPGKVAGALHEYISFIALIGALYVVSGGIHIAMKGGATPLENLALLATGAVAANLLGTTGASMLLIRPYLRNNRDRLSAYHVIFFIFIVSNIGGGITPIGDPPLFLGFIKGIPFFWITRAMLLPWAFALALVLAIFYMVDLLNFRKVSAGPRQEVETGHDGFRISGLGNLIFLAAIIGSVFIERPLFLREAVMIAAAAGSYFSTKRQIHLENHFTFHPIVEVAWLFAGIFVTMLPALDWLSANAPALGIGSSGGFYWVTGGLSSVLDNAPTYLNFLTAGLGLAHLSVDNPAHVREFLLTHGREVAAISAGAVFFGAMTYIGNGPNFMVRAIAEHRGVRMPGFFGYISRFSVPVLLPVLFLVWLIFFS